MGKAPKPVHTRGATHKEPYPSIRNTSRSVSPTRSVQHHSNERLTGAWTTKDDEQLMKARSAGLNWLPISQKYFPLKTSNACRKRHERLVERRNAENWDGTKIEDLAQAYWEFRESMWKPLAERLHEKWEIIEEKCMAKGVKELQKFSRRRGLREIRREPTAPADHGPSYQLPAAHDDSGVVLEGNSSPLGFSQSLHDHSGSSSSSLRTSPPGLQQYRSTSIPMSRHSTEGFPGYATRPPLEPKTNHNILPSFEAFTNFISRPPQSSSSMAYCSS